MKQVLTFFLVLWMQNFTAPDPDIVGIWEHKGASGNVLGLNLKKDGTFVSYVNKKAFTSGQYTYKDGLFSFVEDNGCTDSSGAKIKAVTRAVFFATDSFRVDVIDDKCEDRRKAVNGSRYGRVKKMENNDIIGQWQGNLPNNITAAIHYKKDSTFDVFVNKKMFASGKYAYANNVVTLVEDNGCINKNGDQLKGAYNINFFAPDSIRFEVIYDSCSGRKRDLNHFKLGRIEKNTSK